MGRLRAVALVCGFGLSGMAVGQAPAVCGMAPIPARDARPNLFSDQQEMWLGDAEADQIEADVRLMRDVSLSGHLQTIVDRLAVSLPATDLKFRVTLLDSDEMNGFSLAGGRIYLTRKLVSVAKSDDEIAGVLGHEMGHIVSHQFAFEATAEMKRLLGVSKLGDVADVRAKFVAMLDAELKDKHPGLTESDKDQDEADRIGMYVTAAAGYRPQAETEFWNRVFFVEGKTGNGFSDFLRMTKPSQKRLRGMLAMAAAIPAGCGKDAEPDRSGFAAFQAAAMANRAGVEAVRTEALNTVTLNPPLRMGLERVRFSPDGKSILAQDDSSIFVVNREPLELRYRIDAEDAMPANFSPDSASVTFSTLGLHTEQWSAKEKKLLEEHELLTRDTCYDSKLAADGRTLFCLRLDTDTRQLGVRMLDAANSAVIWEKKLWFQPSYNLEMSLLYSNWLGTKGTVLRSSTSPDGNTLLLGGGDLMLTFDLKDRKLIPTAPGMKKVIGEYAFVGNNALAHMAPYEDTESGLYSFPEGKQISKAHGYLPSFAGLTNTGGKPHVLAGGTKNYASGIADVEAGKVLLGLAVPSVDEFDGTVVAETQGGGLNVWPIGEKDPKARKYVALPVSPLSGASMVAVSPDGKYVAISTKSRGAVWDLMTGAQIYLLRAFSDAMWTNEDVLYVDVAKTFDMERQVLQLNMSPKAAKKMTYSLNDEVGMRYGRMTDWKEDVKGKSWKLAMHDPATNAVLWERNFPDKVFNYTTSFGRRDLLFNFRLDTHTAKEALKGNATLTAGVAAMKSKDNGRLIRVVDGETGKDAGELVVELPPNYAGTDGLNRWGDLLYVQGVDHRTAVYSMATGKVMRQMFGYVRAIDAGTGRVCVTNRRGEAVVYDAEGTELGHYQVGEAIRYAGFREEGTVVSLLTADQTVRTMKVGK